MYAPFTVFHGLRFLWAHRENFGSHFKMSHNSKSYRKKLNKKQRMDAKK
jgi:hypothetical protein